MLEKIKSKKGFTLIEVIVVLVILAIIIALAVPSVMKYIDDANDAKGDIKISYLNKATEGYRVRLYGDGKWDGKTDLFSGIESSQSKQDELLKSKWIDEYQTSIYDDNDYFKWDIAKQRWVRSDGSNSGPTDNDTILGDLTTGNNRGEWKSGDFYKYGDIVKVGERTFKCIVRNVEEIESRFGPVSSNPGTIESYWKEINPEFSMDNIYETGDIVLHNGEYYQATNFDSSYDHEAYTKATIGSDLIAMKEEEILKNVFEKVEWKDGAFVPIE